MGQTAKRGCTRISAASISPSRSLKIAWSRGWPPPKSSATWSASRNIGSGRRFDVRGSVEFRREAWLEAGARGMEVAGLSANRSRSAGARRSARSLGPSHIPAYARRRFVRLSDRDERADRFDYDKGVSGRLIEVGRAPYRNRADAETSTYVAIELDNGRQHRVWGVGLEKATTDSGARPGDHIHVRRDGVERVTKEIKVIDAATGVAGIERRQVPRNRWRVTAETFRAADRLTAARDPDASRGTVTNCSHREVGRTRISKERTRTSEHHGSSQGAHRPTPREGAFVCASDRHGARSRSSSIGARQRSGPSKPERQTHENARA